MAKFGCGVEVKPMMARIGRFYFVVGRAVGGVAGVLLFLAVWMFCIAQFGLVFGVALGWIPAAVVAMVFSVLVTWTWAPLVLLVVVVLSAPAWDRSGRVHKATAQTVAAGTKLAYAAAAQTKKAVFWTQEQARREGLLKN